MTPADIDRVFGRGRLRMVTGDHVEVFREASLPGERRRYTKRFLATMAGDFREWTEREWRILARLVGHGVRAVPQVVQFDRGAADRPALVQTYDAGVTVDHWATLLPLERDGTQLRSVFEDCAHWWALARHCLVALDAIHALQLVHLDLKADNVCIPIAPANFDPHAPGQTLHPHFDELALIDFAFSLVSGEPLDSALPIAHQAEYEYQSPRLLRALDAGRFGNLAPTRQLDWRCDLFSLAAMLWRYLPELEETTVGAWTRPRHARARALVRRLVEAHDAELPPLRPHGELIAFASEALEQPALRESLRCGWRLTPHGHVAAAVSPTPVTRIALPIATTAATPTPIAVAPAAAVTPTAPIAPAFAVAAAEADAASPWQFDARGTEPIRTDPTDVDARALVHGERRRQRSRRAAWAGGVALAAAAVTSVPLLAPDWRSLAGVSAHDRRVALTPALPPQVSADVTKAGGAATTPRAEAAVVAPERVTGGTPTGEPAPAPAATAEPSKHGAAPVAQTAKVETRAATRPIARPPLATRPTASTATRAPAATTPKTLFARASRAAAVPPAVAAAAATAPRSHPKVALAPAASAPNRPGVARTWQDPAAPIPWAVAGRGAPHLAAARPGTAARTPAAAIGTTTVAATATTATTASVTTAAQQPAVAGPMLASVAAAPRDVGPTAFPGARPRDGVAAPAAASPASPPADPPIDFVERANNVMTHQVPRLAQLAERSVAPVLFAAGRSDHVLDDAEVRAGAAAVARGPADPLGGMTLLPRDGQQFNEAARAEYARRGATPEALMLQVRAFGANPLDAEIAGHLAFLLLRQRPAQAEAARQLALHALTLRGPVSAEGKIEDWATFAIASALAGRDRDARNALLVTLALAPNLERQCKAALDVYALYGERLRAPVEAMLQSAHASARGQQSSLCEWPPHWVVSGAR
ncbi:MAG TPA: hypothetical protein VH041_11025 [Caldimonas sp.]|jgi:hypothetical protein|nr:hypothetical protein [Caldimonas sp.]HEX4234830.1 hypothetical protein [Caldimonas sp.]